MGTKSGSEMKVVYVIGKELFDRISPLVIVFSSRGN